MNNYSYCLYKNKPAVFCAKSRTYYFSSLKGKQAARELKAWVKELNYYDSLSDEQRVIFNKQKAEIQAIKEKSKQNYLDNFCRNSNLIELENDSDTFNKGRAFQVYRIKRVKYVMKKYKCLYSLDSYLLLDNTFKKFIRDKEKAFSTKDFQTVLDLFSVKELKDKKASELHTDYFITSEIYKLQENGELRLIKETIIRKFQ